MDPVPNSEVLRLYSCKYLPIPLNSSHWLLTSTTTENASIHLSFTLHVSQNHTATVDEEASLQYKRNNNNNVVNLSDIICELACICNNFPVSSLDQLGKIVVQYLLTRTTQPGSSLSDRHNRVQRANVDLQLVSDDGASYTVLGSAHAPLDVASLPPMLHEVNEWGEEVDVIYESSPPSPSAGLYLLHIQPGHSIPLHIHKLITEVEMIASSPSYTSCQTVLCEYGTEHKWPVNTPHVYFNNSKTEWQTLLCIDSPKFIPTDETVVTEGMVTEGHHHNCKISGKQTWQKVIAPTPSPTLPQPTFTFPGCFPDQTCHLVVDPSSFLVPNAVLSFIFSPVTHANGLAAATSSELGLLFVCHRTRGWELPGGKVEDNETPANATVRETREETGGLELDTNSLQLVAQIHLDSFTTHTSTTKPQHVKSIYVGVLLPGQQPNIADCLPDRETKGVAVVSPPNWNTIQHDKYVCDGGHGSEFSVLLHDNVYPVALELAKAKYAQLTHV